MKLSLNGKMELSGNFTMSLPIPITLIEAIQFQGLTSGLQVVLDAGDITSFSSEFWLDTSGNTHDFFKGFSGISSSGDPSFHGTPGGPDGEPSREEYWLSSGSDFFKLAQSNPAWIDNMHKDGARWSAFAAVLDQDPNIAEKFALFGTHGGAGKGISWLINHDTDHTHQVEIRDGSGDPAEMSQTSTAVINIATAGNDLWNILGVSVDENGGATASVFHTNGVNETFNAAASNTSGLVATHTMNIGGIGDDPGPIGMPNNGRLACFAIWEGVTLTGDDFLSLFNLMSSRFGL